MEIKFRRKINLNNFTTLIPFLVEIICDKKRNCRLHISNLFLIIFMNGSILRITADSEPNLKYRNKFDLIFEERI